MSSLRWNYFFELLLHHALADHKLLFDATQKVRERPRFVVLLDQFLDTVSEPSGNHLHHLAPRPCEVHEEPLMAFNDLGTLFLAAGFPVNLENLEGFPGFDVGVEANPHGIGTWRH